jgi:dynein heavy chain, axonemal
MWDSIAMTNYQYKDWKQQSWRRIKADNLIELNKMLTVQLKNLPREVRSFRGYNAIVD